MRVRNQSTGDQEQNRRQRRDRGHGAESRGQEPVCVAQRKERPGPEAGHVAYDESRDPEPGLARKCHQCLQREVVGFDQLVSSECLQREVVGFDQSD